MTDQRQPQSMTPAPRNPVPPGRGTLVEGDATVDLDVAAADAAALALRARLIKRGVTITGIGLGMVLLAPVLPLGIAEPVERSLHGVVQRQGETFELVEENWAGMRRGEETVARVEVAGRSDQPSARALGVTFSVFDAVEVRVNPGAENPTPAGRALAGDRTALAEVIARGVGARWPETGLDGLTREAVAGSDATSGEPARASTGRVVIGPTLRVLWVIGGLAIAAVGGLGLRRVLG